MQAQNKKASLKDTVYQSIVEMICSGQLTTEMIFTEIQMIERFKVSKSPVREALIQLCHEEVLKSIPRCGYQVVQISVKTIHDLTELRLYIELSSLPKVLENLDEKIILSFRRQNEKRRMEENKDIWSAWNNNLRYHMSLVECAGNIQVNKALERALNVCTRAYAQLYTLQRAVIAPNHESYHDLIIKALESHELQMAQEYLRKDILIMEQQLIHTKFV
jgi:DNA-binding GntR family transcriptional regulator